MAGPSMQCPYANVLFAAPGSCDVRTLFEKNATECFPSVGRDAIVAAPIDLKHLKYPTR